MRSRVVTVQQATPGVDHGPSSTRPRLTAYTPQKRNVAFRAHLSARSAHRTARLLLVEVWREGVLGLLSYRDMMEGLATANVSASRADLAC